MRTDLRAVAAHGALACVAHRYREVDELGQALVVLKRAHNELAILGEHALTVVRGLSRAADVLEGLGTGDSGANDSKTSKK